MYISLIGFYLFYWNYIKITKIIKIMKFFTIFCLVYWFSRHSFFNTSINKLDWDFCAQEQTYTTLLNSIKRLITITIESIFVCILLVRELRGYCLLHLLIQLEGIPAHIACQPCLSLCPCFPPSVMGRILLVYFFLNNKFTVTALRIETLNWTVMISFF